METFDPITPPSVGAKQKREIKLLTASFGDGYSQSSRDGLNHIRRVYSLNWECLARKEAQEILSFLEDHGGDLAFYWTAPGDREPRKWTCDEFSDTCLFSTPYTPSPPHGSIPEDITGVFGTHYVSITATFKQSFNI